MISLILLMFRPGPLSAQDDVAAGGGKTTRRCKAKALRRSGHQRTFAGKRGHANSSLRWNSIREV